MIIINWRRILTVLGLGMVLILPISRKSSAAATPNIPQDCEPTPTDPDVILLCNDYYTTHPPGPPAKDPGTDPDHPVVLPLDGIAGTAASYSPKSDLVLLVAGKFVGANDREMWGVMVDPKTLAVKVPPFRLDSPRSPDFTGNPKVAYNSDADQFLVVWESSVPCANCRSEYGRFVSGDGKVAGSSDFAIHVGAAFLDAVTYDATNKKFVVVYEQNGVSLRTVDESGTVSAPLDLPNKFVYQGQADVAADTNTDQYLVTFAVVAGGGNTPNEDDRIYYWPVDAKTMQPVGDPIQLSQTRLGRLNFAASHIAYSTKGGGAMAIWLERGRVGVAGNWGRTINDDGTLSNEYEVVTADNNPYSEGFAASGISYNPWTDSFFVPSGDWNGDAWVTEIDLSGLVFDQSPAVNPVSLGINRFAELFGIHTVQAAATGSFNISLAVTPYGSSTFASRNYQSVVGTSYQSINAPNNVTVPPLPTPTPTAPKDYTALPKLINQIYIWSLGVGALLALLMLIVGGYYYMTSAGNAEQADKGKEIIWGAIIGLALLFGSYLLLNTINPDLVKFNVNSLQNLDNSGSSTTTSK